MAYFNWPSVSFLSGASTAPAFVPTGATIPANGMYLSAANQVSLATNSTEVLRLTASGVVQVLAGTVGAPGIALGEATTGLYLSATGRPAVTALGTQILNFGSSGSERFFVFTNAAAGRGSVFLNSDDAELRLVAGVGTSVGRQIYAYGSTHGSKPDRLEFRRGANIDFTMDNNGSGTFNQVLSLTGPLAIARLDVASAASIAALSNANGFVRLTGATATTILGIAAGINGQRMTIVNLTGANMTTAHEDVGASAANRITTMTGANVLTTGNGTAEFVYDTGLSRWINTFVTA